MMNTLESGDLILIRRSNLSQYVGLLYRTAVHIVTFVALWSPAQHAGKRSQRRTIRPLWGDCSAKGYSSST